MTEPNRTTVYSFRLYDGHFESPRIPGFKATLEAIERLGGDRLQGSGQEVADDELDEGGCYRRINTGWSELS